MSVFSTVEAMLRRAEPDSFEFISALSTALWRHAEEADASNEVPAALFETFGFQALNIALVPSSYGGRSTFGSLRRRQIVNYWLGRGDPALAIALPGPSLASPPMCVLASHEQKQSFYRQFVQDERPVWAAFALTESHGGSDAAGLRTTAQRTVDGWRLKGSKQYIGNASRARQAVVFATIDERMQRFGIRAFLVDLDSPGIVVKAHHQVLGLRCLRLSTIELDDVAVGADRQLVDPLRARQSDAFEGAQGAWDFMRPSLSSMICGAAMRALDELEAAMPSSFSKPTIARRVAEQRDRAQVLRGAVESALGICMRAADEFDHGRTSSTLGSAAKALAATAALDVADLVVTASAMCPGALPTGFADRYVRNARAFDILEGTGEMQRLMVARQVGAVSASRFANVMSHFAARAAAPSDVSSPSSSLVPSA